MEIDEGTFEIKKLKDTRVNRPNEVGLLVEVGAGGVVTMQMSEEGVYAGDADSLATIELTPEEVRALKMFLFERTE